MIKKVKPKQTGIDPRLGLFNGQFPHCDAKVTHAPGECQYCDKHPLLQVMREFYGIAFSGYEPEEGELPCPADFARPGMSQKWGGNVPRPKLICKWGNVCDGERIEGSDYCIDHSPEAE